MQLYTILFLIGATEAMSLGQMNTNACLEANVPNVSCRPGNNMLFLSRDDVDYDQEEI